MSGDWKLIHYHEDGRDELYNIRQDIGEQSNVLADHPDRASDLRADLDRWLKSVDAQMPTANSNFDRAGYEGEQRDIREVQLPRLEREHAALLRDDYSPPDGWWEETGK
jgi:arylsulfatase A-like enzyme